MINFLTENRAVVLDALKADLRLVYSGVIVVLQWCYSDVTEVLSSRISG
jgi:hypothetical protein